MNLSEREKRVETTLQGPSFPSADQNAKYTGEWQKGFDIREGRGVLTRANGEHYDGYFKDDKFDGKGKFVFAANDKYDRKQYIGQFKNGHFHGYGTMVLNNSDSYKAIWDRNIVQGQGRI